VTPPGEPWDAHEPINAFESISWTGSRWRLWKNLPGNPPKATALWKDYHGNPAKRTFQGLPWQSFLGRPLATSSKDYHSNPTQTAALWKDYQGSPCKSAQHGRITVVIRPNFAPPLWEDYCGEPTRNQSTGDLNHATQGGTSNGTWTRDYHGDPSYGGPEAHVRRTTVVIPPKLRRAQRITMGIQTNPPNMQGLPW
jgi:hypothetical protein